MHPKPCLIKIRIKNRDLALFKYIIESYEHLATISTLDSDEGIIGLYIPKGNLKTVSELLEGMKKEIEFHVLEKTVPESDA